MIPTLYAVWNDTLNCIWTMPVVRPDVARDHLRISEQANPSSRFRVVTLVIEKQEPPQ